MSYCSKCGTKVENENFCYNCGAKIEKEPETIETSASGVTQVSTVSQSSLAPSELVLLRAEEFAKKGRMSNITIMNTNVTVNPEQLGKAILNIPSFENFCVNTAAQFFKISIEIHSSSMTHSKNCTLSVVVFKLIVNILVPEYFDMVILLIIRFVAAVQFQDLLPVPIQNTVSLVAE